MKFKTVAEAFNHYRTMDITDMEKRTKEIDTIITTDPNADIEALNIELRGIKEAKENYELRVQSGNNFNVITGTSTQKHETRNFENDVLGTAEYRSAFFKTLLGQNLTETEKAAMEAAAKEAEKRADDFNTSTDSVAVLPTTTLNEVIKKARTTGGLLAECRAFAVPTKIAIPIGTPSSKAAWHTEGAEVESEKATVTNVVFDGYEIIKIFSISAKAKKMSIEAFESYFVEELTACVMECIEDGLVNGTGEGQGTGLITGVKWEATNTVTVAKTGTLSYANIVKAISLLKKGYAAGAKWAMSNATLYNSFYGLVDTTGRPIFIADPKAEGIGKILGFEVVIDDNIPSDTAILGNYSKYLGYNLPDGIIIETSRESSFKKGLIDYRAMAIADCKPLVTEAFVKIDKATA